MGFSNFIPTSLPLYNIDIVDISDSNSYLYMLDIWRGNNSHLLKECSMTLIADGF